MGVWAQRLRSGVLSTLTGDNDGRPYWVDKIESGDDNGFFGPDSAAWVVHGGMPTMIAGIRALLMQTLHPGAMAGVHDWSRYQEDPLGRLSGTIQWLVTVTFADTAVARAETARVERFHGRVSGTYLDASEQPVPYSAGDPELLSWVHVVFADAFLATHLVWGGRIPGGPDAYVREWATAGELLGAPNPPRSQAELAAQLESFRAAGALKFDARVAEAVSFIRNPPLSRAMMPAYRIMFAGAVASLEPHYRRMLGLRRAWWPAVGVNRLLLGAIRVLLGPSSPSEDAARQRIHRLAAGGGISVAESG